MDAPIAEKIKVEKFNLECLERVNELRKQFKVPPLKLRLTLIYKPKLEIHAPSNDIYSGAQEWAAVLAQHDILLTDLEAAKNEIGESICRLHSERFSNFSGSAVIDAWFDEANELKGPLSMKNNCHPINFLQLIWSRTRYCGFGFAVSPTTSAMYAVARFKPILPESNEILVPAVNQEMHKFEAANGPMTFKHTIENNLSQDVSYVKRNLFCNIPESIASRNESPEAMKPERYRLSHIIRQFRVSNRIGRQRLGLGYISDQINKPTHTFLSMQNED